MARVVDDGTNVPVLPIVRLGTTERLYLRGADLAIVNSGACSLLAQTERLECLEKFPRHRAASGVTEPGLAPAANICTVAYGSVLFNPARSGG